MQKYKVEECRMSHPWSPSYTFIFAQTFYWLRKSRFGIAKSAYICTIIIFYFLIFLLTGNCAQYCFRSWCIRCFPCKLWHMSTFTLKHFLPLLFFWQLVPSHSITYYNFPGLSFSVANLNHFDKFSVNQALQCVELLIFSILNGLFPEFGLVTLWGLNCSKQYRRQAIVCCCHAQVPKKRKDFRVMV